MLTKPEEEQEMPNNDTEDEVCGVCLPCCDLTDEISDLPDHDEFCHWEEVDVALLKEFPRNMYITIKSQMAFDKNTNVELSFDFSTT